MSRVLPLINKSRQVKPNLPTRSPPQAMHGFVPSHSISSNLNHQTLPFPIPSRHSPRPRNTCAPTLPTYTFIAAHALSGIILQTQPIPCNPSLDSGPPDQDFPRPVSGIPARSCSGCAAGAGKQRKKRLRKRLCRYAHWTYIRFHGACFAPVRYFQSQRCGRGLHTSLS